MYPHHEQFTAAVQANIKTSLTLANAAIASAESLAALNLNTGRNVLDVMVANTKALLAAKDRQEFVALQAAMIQPAVEKSIAYSRRGYEIASRTQEEVAKLIQTRFGEASKNVVTTANAASAKKPTGAPRVRKAA